MTIRLINKFIFLLIAFLFTITLTFFLMKAIPGDPFSNKKAIPAEILEAMKTHYGFDQPIWVQYKQYLTSAIKGDLGPSFKYKGRSVRDIIHAGFFKSMQLGLQALCLSLVGGMIIGAYFAFHKKKQTFFIITTSLFICIPSFIFAAVLQYVFAIKIPLFPVARWTGFSATILPTVALASLPLAFIAKLTRNSMLQLINSDAIKLVRSKGISATRILFVHLLPASITPVIAYLGFDLASILAGSFIVEKVFAIPGIGYALVAAVMNRDYTVIMGMTMFYSLLFLLAIFISDLILLWLNPKLREKRYA